MNMFMYMFLKLRESFVWLFTQHRHTKDSMKMEVGNRRWFLTHSWFRCIFLSIFTTLIKPSDVFCSLHSCTMEQLLVGLEWGRRWTDDGRKRGSEDKQGAQWKRGEFTKVPPKFATCQNSFAGSEPCFLLGEPETYRLACNFDISPISTLRDLLHRLHEWTTLFPLFVVLIAVLDAGRDFLKPLHLSSLLNGVVMQCNDGMKVLTWLSAERRGMERVRPCPSTGW